MISKIFSIGMIFAATGCFLMDKELAAIHFDLLSIWILMGDK